MSSTNGMNLYRGCSHGCIYCDSRSKCYHMEHAFEDIEVKENALDLLEHALRHKKKKCMIGTGSMTDPYIPLETELGTVRKALQLIYEHGFGFTVITKSDRILRDLDLLQKINERTKSVQEAGAECKYHPGAVCAPEKAARRRNSFRCLAVSYPALYQRYGG